MNHLKSKTIGKSSSKLIIDTERFTSIIIEIMMVSFIEKSKSAVRSLRDIREEKISSSTDLSLMIQRSKSILTHISILKINPTTLLSNTSSKRWLKNLNWIQTRIHLFKSEKLSLTLRRILFSFTITIRKDRSSESQLRSIELT